MSKTFSKKIDKSFNVSVSSFFWFYRALGFFSTIGVPKHYQNKLHKNRVDKFLQKIDKQIQTRFSLDFFYHVFGRFSARGVRKHYFFWCGENEIKPGPSLASDPTTHHGGPWFCFAALWPKTKTQEMSACVCVVVVAVRRTSYKQLMHKSKEKGESRCTSRRLSIIFLACDCFCMCMPLTSRGRR
jgi:hypothetical protein